MGTNPPTVPIAGAESPKYSENKVVTCPESLMLVGTTWVTPGGKGMKVNPLAVAMKGDSELSACCT
jgi:hypothetical protein